MLEYPKQRSKQPQAAAPIRQSGIGRGIFVSIDRNFGYVNGVLVPANNYGGTGLPPLAPGPAGIGNNTTGALVDRRLLVDGPLAATAPWTIAVTLSATANVSLSHIFGFGLFYSGTALGASSTGQNRAILNYLNNYYWWGESADWNTGVAFDIDGIVRTIVFAHDGTNIYFYRAGVLAGSTARPAGVSTTPAGRYAVLGNKHSSGTNSPSATIYNGRAWNRCLTASEVVEYSGNPNCVYAPRSIWVPVSAGGPAPATATSSLSAAIQAAGLQQTSLSAAIQIARSATASISAAIQAANAASASVDSAIQAQQTAAATVNSVIQVATSVQSALDAVLQIARTQSSSLNSAILQEQSETASLNAYIQAGFTASASVSAAIQSVNTGNASLDTVIQQALSGTASVSAAVLSSLTTNATVSAAVQRALSLTATISAAVQVAGSASASLNTYIQAGSSVSSLIDAAILEAKSATASLNSVISLSGEVSASLSAVISAQLAISVATSAAIQDLRSAAATLSAYITDPLAVITNSEWWMYDMPVNDLEFDMPVSNLTYTF